VSVDSPTGWPDKGKIVFENVTLRYSLISPPVLSNITWEIPAGTKVGIVGRTGAGKSSIIAALFRLAPYTGTIFLDGVAACSVPVQRLRRCFGVIPQEPMLFSESVHHNIDPFDEFSLEEVWSALDAVQLRQVVERLPNGIATKLSESGSNLSVGQRQLVCLARAVLRQSKILVLDEATANVDYNTDQIIQKTIRERFQASTVLCVAHRLNTVIDYDRIAVFDFGRLVEYDSPANLLRRPNSVFASLVAQSH
jgi:ATP-binding cassette, subfamily C (CFTR/MRP), member 4